MKYLSKCLGAVAMLAMVVVTCQMSLANQLTDPGFEDPNAYVNNGVFFGEWEPFDNGGNTSSIHDTTMPRNGTGHANLSIMGDDNSFAGVFQSIVANPGEEYSGGFWHKNPNTAQLGVNTEVRIEWHDAGGGEIGRVENNSNFPGQDYEWVPVAGIAPAGAVEARLVYAIATFGGEQDGGGSSTGTIFLDDAELIPEPASLALLAMAGLGIASVRRRK